MKSRPIIGVVLLVLVVCAAGAAIRYLDRTPRERLAALLGITLTVGTPGSPEVTPLPPTPTPIPLSDRLPALMVGTVAIQTSAGQVPVRSGSGTVVSGDGLIVTTTAVAPWGSGSYAYRVVLSSGVSVPARRLLSDAGTGLVLLKAEAPDVAVVAFVDAPVRTGDELWAVGVAATRGGQVPQVLEVAVVAAADTQSAVLSLDREHLARMAGARLVDRQGRTVGIVRPGAPIGITDSLTVNALIARYLDSHR